MRIKQLEYFIAVAEARSFSKVAKEFFVSQATVSNQIAALERAVGKQLFERDNHHVKLTMAGALFLDDARAIVGRTTEAVRRARAADDMPEGELKVGYIKGYERTDLADMLFGFHQGYPNVRLSFMRDNVSELYDALRREDIDVCINLLYNEYRMSDMQWQVLRSYPLHAVVPLDHPLAHRQSIRIEDLKGYPIVDATRGASGYGESEAIAATLAKIEEHPKIAYVSEDVETSVLCVAAGLGYALLPGYLTQTFPTNGKVVAIPIEGKSAEMTIAAAWLPQRKNDLLDVFLDEFLITND